MSIMTIGSDLAKNIFAAHGVDENDNAALIVQLPSRLVGIEACPCIGASLAMIG